MTDYFPEKLRILVVDDDEVDRLTIQRNLKRLFHQCEFVLAETIEEGEKAIQDHEFDCIFIDYRLPGGDGIELIRSFREKGVNFPIIVVTSQGDEKIAVEVMKAGASDYIQKNILKTDILGQVLRNAIRSYKLEEERKRTANALEQSQARLYEAQRIADIGSWEVDLNTGERYWSDQVYRILGYPETSTVNLDQEQFLKHIHPDSVAKSEQAFRDCVIKGIPIKFDIQILTVKGSPRYVEIHGRPIRSSDGRTQQVVGTVQDITHRKESEQALILARDEAQRLAKAKEEFLANMSHEIRTPMNAIIGYTKLLYKTSLDDTQREYLNSIDHAGTALIAIINDILDLSRIESGRLEFEHHSFSLRELLQSLVRMFGVRSSEKSIPITIEIQDGVTDKICGDPVRLNQILINLVGNALKFTEKGRVTIRVSVTEKFDKEVRLKFEVIDTGIGIELGKQESIFESFTQASSDTTRKYGGSGLGLTISKRLVELQHGKIGLESTPGKGSNFYFELPFSPCKTSMPQPPIEIPSCDVTTEPVKVRVLVADDIELNRRLAGIILGGAGHQFQMADNGKEALGMVKKGGFDLVLMDIQMPEMDGYQATKEIRNLPDPLLKNIPIIALTAHAMPEQISKILDSGFTDCISKPFQPEQLLSMVQKHCKLSGKTQAPVDLDALDELAAGDTVLKQELIQIFQRDVPASVQKLRTAWEQQDVESMKRTLHALKPSLLLFKVKDAKEIISSLEDACERVDLNQAGQLVKSLSAITDSALHVLA